MYATNKKTISRNLLFSGVGTIHQNKNVFLFMAHLRKIIQNFKIFN